MSTTSQYMIVDGEKQEIRDFTSIKSDKPKLIIIEDVVLLAHFYILKEKIDNNYLIVVLNGKTAEILKKMADNNILNRPPRVFFITKSIEEKYKLDLVKLSPCQEVWDKSVKTLIKHLKRESQCISSRLTALL